MKIGINNLLLGLLITSLNLYAYEDKSYELKILVYNTHGLPGVFLSDKPDIRFPEISKKTNLYSIALLQEDYAHHEKLISNFNENTLAYRNLPENNGLCLFCTGSGLTVVSNLPDDWKIEVENRTFTTCSGWIRGANDCFAYKGFQLIKISPTLMDSFFILNTHMDAGRRDSDRAARREQLIQITSFLKEKVKDGALILAGDLNLNSKSSKDMELLDMIKENLNLKDLFSNVEINKKWSILDYILIRDGKAIKFNIKRVGEDESFKNKDGPLSDHPALFVELSVNS